MTGYTLNDYEGMVKSWSNDRKILQNSTPQQQFLKLVSEMGELADSLAKGQCVKDDIGDCLVVLTNIAAMEGTNLAECFAYAYEDIRDRRGFLNENGVFVKDTDDAYQHQVAMELA